MVCSVLLPHTYIPPTSHVSIYVLLSLLACLRDAPRILADDQKTSRCIHHTIDLHTESADPPRVAENIVEGEFFFEHEAGF